jgi:hypothetical protein
MMMGLRGRRVTAVFCKSFAGRLAVRLRQALMLRKLEVGYGTEETIASRASS